MQELKIVIKDGVDKKFLSFPKNVQKALSPIRQLIIDCATELDDVHHLEESLKWGELSYKTKQGSPVRVNWSSKEKDHFGIYFICSTSLVETFKFVFGDEFNYDKNRGLIFGLEDEIPEEAVKRCVKMAMRYKELKHLPFLGNVT